MCGINIILSDIPELLVVCVAGPMIQTCQEDGTHQSKTQPELTDLPPSQGKVCVCVFAGVCRCVCEYLHVCFCTLMCIIMTPMLFCISSPRAELTGVLVPWLYHL